MDAGDNLASFMASLPSAEAARAELERRSGGRFRTIFPDEGPYRRGLYPKHMELFRAGATHRERLFLKANRTGGTRGGAYEVTCHATGLYPAWWEGRRFHKATDIWVAGDTAETTRDILQAELLGPVGQPDLRGTAMLPPETIYHTLPGRIPQAISVIYVRHTSGDLSQIALKSYDQGRQSFQGTQKHVCIAAGELVQMASGALCPIEEVRAGDMVLVLDTDGTAVERRVIAARENGDRECVMVRPRIGAPLICTPDHELYWGYNRWSKKRAEVATRIAQPRPAAWWPVDVTDREPWWYVWSALIVAKGCVAQKKVTNGDIAAMGRAIETLPPRITVRRHDYTGDHVPDWHVRHDPLWSEFAGQRSETKKIPSFVFTSSRAMVRLFLRWLYMGDGWAHGHTIGYATTSLTLAQQLIVLLQRLGIRATYHRRVASRWTWRDQHWVCIARARDVILFADEIGIESKESAVALVRAEGARRSASKRSRATHLVIHGRGDRGRSQRALDKSSRITGCNPVGVRRVFDLSVDGWHRFLVGTSLVSNCWLDEEAPEDIYGEVLLRTMDTGEAFQGGIVLLTYTPINGLTPLTASFLPQEHAAFSQGG